MIMEIWNKFSYMIQLIIACMMFLGVVRRKNHFIQRFTIGVVILLVSSYVVNSVYAGQELFAWTVLYWMYFLVACVFFAGLLSMEHFWRHSIVPPAAVPLSILHLMYI